MYKEGDMVPGLGIVDTNHCGLPWLQTIDGGAYGVLHIYNTEINIDAMTGEVLTDDEISKRINNSEFDYENKSSDCVNWRKRYQPYGPYVTYTPSLWKRFKWWIIRNF